MTRRILLVACSLVMLSPHGAVVAAERSAADQALLAKAIKACNGPQYPSGARPVVNYGRGTFQCVEPGSTRH